MRDFDGRNLYEQIGFIKRSLRHDYLKAGLRSPYPLFTKDLMQDAHQRGIASERSYTEYERVFRSVRNQ